MWHRIVEQAEGLRPMNPPATSEQLADLEQTLSVTLPEKLIDLLTSSNGIEREYLQIVWSIKEIKKQNREMRDNTDFTELYMPFDHLFFFGDRGNGDLIGCRVLKGQIDLHNVYR